MRRHRWVPTGKVTDEAVGMRCERCGLSFWCQGFGSMPVRTELTVGRTMPDGTVEWDPPPPARELHGFETPDASCERRGVPLDCDEAVCAEVLQT